MSTHTPGPWTQCDRIVVVCPPSHEYSTWIANASVGGNSGAEQLANARLIAAAPELLEELNNCFDLLNTCFPDAPVESCIGVAIIKARAAIAKATGASA